MENSPSSYLKSASSQGKLISSGTFTIKAQRALEKLARHTLEHKNEWILKAVQAAVAAKGTRLQIKVCRKQLTLNFFLPQIPSLEQVTEQLLQPTQDGEPFFRELIVGLRTLMFHHTFSLLSAAGEKLFWDGEALTLSQVKRDDEEEWSLRLTVSNEDRSKRRTGWPFSFFRAREASEYSTLLQRKACFAPLQITLDGRDLRWTEQVVRSHYPRRRQASSSPLRLVSCRFQPQPKIDISSMKKTPATDGLFQDRLHTTEPFFSLEPHEPVTNPGHLFLFVSYYDTLHGKAEKVHQNLAEVEWVRRKVLPESFYFHATRLGVVCWSKEYPSTSLGGAVHVPCDSAKTDLTGLKSQPQVEVANQTMQMLNPVVLEVANEIRYHHTPRVRVHSPLTLSKTPSQAQNTTNFAILAGSILLNNPYVSVTSALVGVVGSGAVGMVATLPLKKDSAYQLNAILVAIQNFTNRLSEDRAQARLSQTAPDR